MSSYRLYEHTPVICFFVDVQNHARSRHKVPDSSAERLFQSIVNGDASDAELSDDEFTERDTTTVVSRKITPFSCVFRARIENDILF